MEHQFPSFPALCASLFFIFMALKIWKKSKTKNKTPLPPGPWKLPIIGNIHLLVGCLPHYRLRDLAKVYGSIMHLQLGQISSVVISSAEVAKEVMKTHDIMFAQRPASLAFRDISYNCNDIVFSRYGDYWRQVRKICILELLSVKRVQSFTSVRVEEVTNLISALSSRAGLPVNLSKMLYSLTYGITSRISFGKKSKDQDAFISVVEEIMKMGAGFTLPDMYPSFKFLQLIGGMRSKLQRLCQEADWILENILNDHKSSEGTTKPAGEGEEDDLVDVLLKLQASGHPEYRFTTDNIKAIIVDIFIAGSETSTTTVEWAVSELLKNPRIMEKAQAEVRKVFGQKGDVEETGLHELTYLELVIKETMRLHPAGPLLLPRECRETCEINGYKIPAKSRITINAWAIARDPKYWTDPETFYPERFLDSSIDYKGTNFEFIPFGAGRRMCPGIAYAMANIQLPLAQLLYHFDWKLAGGLKPETLDMTEMFGTTVRRKYDLDVIPIPYHPLPVE